MDLDALLAELIEDAIRRYGPRYRETWTIAPVVVQGDSYPETIVKDDDRVIHVRVTNLVRASPFEARYQLGHEAIHCLLATGNRKTIYFEEGLALHHALKLPGLPRPYRRASERKLPNVLRAPLAAFRALNPTDEAIMLLRKEVANVDDLKAPAVERIFKVSPEAATLVCQCMSDARPQKM